MKLLIDVLRFFILMMIFHITPQGSDFAIGVCAVFLSALSYEAGIQKGKEL